MEIVRKLVAGDVRSLARAISLVEENVREAPEVLRQAFPHAGRATVLGITGPPGAGKSTLVDRLVGAYRAAGRRVGVVAVDPSSAFSGGAILGDRVRMQDHAGDAGVFIRSMATRGHLGGLARAANDAIDLMDAAGFDPILVETVGVGQDEVEVVRTADAVAVVLVPGMGDDIQAIKAGILEIADLFVINKSDRPGTDRLVADLETMLSLVPDATRPAPALVRAVAVDGRGVAEIVGAVERCLAGGGTARRRARLAERAETRLLAVLGDRLLAKVLAGPLEPSALRTVVDDIAARRTDPYTAAERVLARVEVR
jgi:LAO/AO transport system kinase